MSKLPMLLDGADPPIGNLSGDSVLLIAIVVAACVIAAVILVRRFTRKNRK